MKEIELTQGLVALCDDEDYESLQKLNWYTARAGGHIYAETAMGEGRILSMHRFIFGMPEGVEIYHLNGNGLDNRRENLSIRTRHQRMVGHKLRQDNVTGYKGVSKVRSKWRAVAGSPSRGTRHHLGYFDTPEEAAEAYNKVALELYGEYALLNDIDNKTHVKEVTELPPRPPRRPPRKPSKNSSGFVGVSYMKQKKKWRSRINKDGKEIHLGLYSTSEEAAAAYNQKAIELYGDLAILNHIISEI